MLEVVLDVVIVVEVVVPPAAALKEAITLEKQRLSVLPPPVQVGFTAPAVV